MYDANKVIKNIILVLIGLLLAIIAHTLYGIKEQIKSTALCADNRVAIIINIPEKGE